jgi:hypothetical protein
LPDSRPGVQRNPAIMCEAGFGFREKTGFGSKLIPFNLRTGSEPQFYRQLGQWSTLAGWAQRFKRFWLRSPMLRRWAQSVYTFS